MKKIAMIMNGIVENIALWDGSSDWHPDDYTLVDVTDIECAIGWEYINGGFVAPELEF